MRGGEGVGRVGLCYCPGKIVKKPRARAGHEDESSAAPISRDLRMDLAYLRRQHGVDRLVCLLNDAELRSLGVDPRDYPAAVSGPLHASRARRCRCRRRRRRRVNHRTRRARGGGGGWLAAARRLPDVRSIIKKQGVA